MMKFFKILVVFCYVSGNAQSNFKTVKIGNQEWMAENLHTDHYLNGDPIANVDQRIPWGNLKTGAFCIFSNYAPYGIKYGYLYNLQAIKDPRGLIPKGWHIPTVADWEELIYFLGGRDSAAFKIKNVNGFNALPSGARLPDYKTDFLGEGSFAMWWSSTDGKVMFRSMTDSASGTFFYETSKYPFELRKNLAEMKSSFGLSIRCIKDRDPNVKLPSIERKAKIGLIILDITQQLADEKQFTFTKGVYVNEVVAGGAGDQAEIQTGDIITEINGEKVIGSTDFIVKLSKHQPGEYIKVKVVRPSMAEMQMTVDVKLK